MDRAHSLRVAAVSLWIVAAVAAARPAAAVTFNADISYTSDYIQRGISESAGRSAGQIDLRLTTADGTFAGIFASTLGRVRTGWARRGWDYKLEEYLGHEFTVSGSWSATVTAVNYSYLNGNVPFSNDYQELSVAGSYLDLWTVTLAAIPSTVHWDGGYRTGRYPAYTADTSIQLPLAGRLLFIGGAGYYTSDSNGYAYGNVGLAFEFKSLRVEAGYYVAQDRAQQLLPYGRAGSRFAGTVLWHF